METKQHGVCDRSACKGVEQDLKRYDHLTELVYDAAGAAAIVSLECVLPARLILLDVFRSNLARTRADSEAKVTGPEELRDNWPSTPRPEKAQELNSKLSHAWLAVRKMSFECTVHRVEQSDRIDTMSTNVSKFADCE
eukprot:4900733-Pleurochrysis_carterae.AAC.1